PSIATLMTPERSPSTPARAPSISGSAYDTVAAAVLPSGIVLSTSCQQRNDTTRPTTAIPDSSPKRRSIRPEKSRMPQTTVISAKMIVPTRDGSPNDESLIDSPRVNLLLPVFLASTPQKITASAPAAT